ncbi:C39 family peptidase [Loigolactobacillus binensis]|uniref:C39 family peptidase n=1 Tax=Loigolactobacillus binensis TaxID=2559922 RepID=A0ABW3EF53_9LACO|nr:C39 family peptidase [Loigolactobacillus binensis]
MKVKKIGRGLLVLVPLLAVVIASLLFVGWHTVPSGTSAPVALENGWDKLTKQQPVAFQLQVAAKAQRPVLPTGCEITDVAMLLAFRGKPQSLTKIANEIPYTDDPETGFWGNPFTDTGYTMYPPAWRSYFEKHLGSFTDLSKKPVSTFRTELAQGKPIVAWVKMHGFPAHAILLTGYAQDNFVYNDPWTGKSDRRISGQQLWQRMASQHYRAMTY